ncbi:MAG: hypothetical protein ABR543_09440 [Gemmatimonadaceae bacterium]
MGKPRLQKEILAVIVGVLLAASASTAAAQARPDVPGREEIAKYRLRKASVSVAATAGRIELLVVDGPAAMVVYLDEASVTRWLDNNAWLLDLDARTRPDTSSEFSSVILKHSDPSYASGLILTRSFRGRKPTSYLTTWVGRTRHTVVQMSTAQTRSLALALGRAAQVSRSMKLAVTRP